MKYLKSTVIALFSLFAIGFFSNSAQSQTPKFAHIDYLKVVDSIPSMMAADKEIQGFLDAGQKTILEMEQALDDEYNKYLTEKPTLSTVMQELREKQLMEQQQMLEYKKQSLQQDLEILNQRLYGPIEENLKKAIEIVALRYKVTYVLEVTSLLYTDPAGGLDLTKEVRTELLRLEKERTGL